MKKIFLYILAGSLCFSACKKDDDEVATFVEPDDIAVRNSYDDQAIQKFMDENYLDVQGNIKTFSATDTADDNYKKLSQLAPKTLPSGVIYIVRDGVQPDPGVTLETNSSAGNNATQIRTMMRGTGYVAANIDGNTTFSSIGNIINTINGDGSPVTDPSFYYVKNSVLNASNNSDAAKQRSYYEIEGLQEGLKYFKGFQNMNDGDPYNLQGVIIVPSRAAFARDAHFPYSSTYSLKNTSFVFNFQIYKANPRPSGDQ
ncbi:hypothetical protein ASG22_03865 [Chryseobacterium sp. Leaf405]|uniref:hypothetical protein n=1 Tax=Chryseobacterium sp. Leaf405 TaxID=1736367 RepID=UPI0006F30756|nr:hypothetical protein [Chryseobacterium sp. Leaf405]KQT25850.1 hypothetical protein ASG22_03865 [Chryseobacterium sp. Leaf405]